MMVIQRGLMVSVLCLFLIGLPRPLPAQTPSEKNPQEIVTLLKEQNRN